MIEAKTFEEKEEYISEETADEENKTGVYLYRNPDFKKALIGIDMQDGRAIYDYDLMIESLMEDEGWTYDEAVDWIGYNTLGTRSDTKRLPIVIERFG